ncbi:MAG: OsmC family protein [Anaerolineae bacterium]|nr:OsmC family protein [Anaerolineae bacterium]
MQAHLKWTDGLQFVARADGGPAVVIDSREGASGASPMQLMLMGIAGCTAIDVAMILQKRRAPFSGLEVNIRGERAEEYPQRFTAIEIEYVVHGKDIKPKDVERAIQLSESKYCSATASLNAEVTHSHRIVEE